MLAGMAWSSYSHGWGRFSARYKYLIPMPLRTTPESDTAARHIIKSRRGLSNSFVTPCPPFYSSKGRPEEGRSPIRRGTRPLARCLQLPHNCFKDLQDPRVDHLPTNSPLLTPHMTPQNTVTPMPPPPTPQICLLRNEDPQSEDVRGSGEIRLGLSPVWKQILQEAGPQVGRAPICVP